MSKKPRGSPYTEYEFLARQSAELPAYWHLKQIERSGTLYERSVATVADLAIILDRTEEICEGNEGAQDPDAGDEPPRPRGKAARRQEQADQLESFEPYDETDPQFERLSRLFDDYDLQTKWAACQNDQFRRLTDRDAERGSLYAPFVTQSTIPGVGLGLFAGANAPTQSLVARYEGELVPTDLVHTPEYKSAYAFKISKAWSIDARADPWTPGRYINHSRVKGRNVQFSVHRATNSVKIVTTKGVARGSEFYLNYGPEFFGPKGHAPESDENTVSLQHRFLDYYDRRPEVSAELRDEADQDPTGWAQLVTPDESPLPPPAPAPALPEEPEREEPERTWRYWTAKPMPDVQLLTEALARSRIRPPSGNNVCHMQNWESAAMRPIASTIDAMPLMRWKKNSCFADALVLALFSQSYAFDPMLSIPSDSDNPVERASDGLKRPLRKLINELRTSSSVDFLADDLIGDLRREFQDQIDLPLAIRQVYGRHGATGSFGSPEELLEALIERPALAPLDSSVLPVPWALLPEVRDGPIIDRYPSLIVQLESVPDTLADAIVAEWTNDGRRQLLHAPHAFVVHYRREEGIAQALPVPLELSIDGRRYLLRSAVFFRSEDHYAAFVRDQRTDKWYLIDPAAAKHPRRQLDARTTKSFLEGTARRDEPDLRFTASLMLYEALAFVEQTLEPPPPHPDPDATLGALFGTGVDRVMRQSLEMYRTKRLRSDPGRPTLLPPRDYLALGRPRAMPFPNSRDLDSVELLMLAIATAGEAWDYAIGYAPDVVRRIEQERGKIHYGPKEDRQYRDPWFRRQLFLLANRANAWDLFKDKFDEDEAAKKTYAYVQLRNAIFDGVFNPARAGNRYPAPTGEGLEAAAVVEPVDRLSDGARKQIHEFLGQTLEQAGMRLSGMVQNVPFWLPRECTLRSSADGEPRRLVLDRSVAVDAFEQALVNTSIGNLPAVFIARTDDADALNLPGSVTLRQDLARCYDLDGLLPTYTLVAVLLEHPSDKPALVHRQCGLGGYWVRWPDRAPEYVADLDDALRLVSQRGYRPRMLLYQNAAFDAPPAFY